MAFIFEGNDALYKKIDKYFNFNKEVETISDLNEIFFHKKNKFFLKVEKEYSEEGKEFIKIYQYLQKLALNIKEILPIKEIPLLKTKEKKRSLKLTRRQVALLFLLSFFKIIENTHRFNVYYILDSNSGVRFQFGRCFLNYLITIGKWLEKEDKEKGKEVKDTESKTTEPKEVDTKGAKKTETTETKEEEKEKYNILDEYIIYIRDNIESQEYLENGNKDLCEITLNEKDSLFDGKESSYCIDFANKYIGGGALTGGCVQEEILFAVEPEATVSMLFMEVMDENDAIGIYNTIEFSKYTGYGSTFKFEKSAITDDLSLNKIKKHKIIAIDAIVSRGYFSFFSHSKTKDINRDIHKAYVGFNLVNFETEKDTQKIISTGNWGCGAFGGNHELKFIQQWIAASFVPIKRLDYYTFDDSRMKIVVENYNKIKEKYKTANSLYNAINKENIHIEEGKVIINLLK